MSSTGAEPDPEPDTDPVRTGPRITERVACAICPPRYCDRWMRFNDDPCIGRFVVSSSCGAWHHDTIIEPAEDAAPWDVRRAVNAERDRLAEHLCEAHGFEIDPSHLAVG